MTALAPLLVLLGAVLGSAGGLFIPVLLLIAIDFKVGSGSYEDFIPIWLATVPIGMLLGIWAGVRVFEAARARWFKVHDQASR